MYKNRKLLVTLFGVGLTLNVAVIVRDFVEIVLLRPHFNDVRPVIALSIVGLLIVFPIVYISRLLVLVSGSFPDKLITVTGSWWMRILFVVQLLSFCIGSFSGYSIFVHYQEYIEDNGIPFMWENQWWGTLIILVALMNGFLAFLGIGLHKFVRIGAREKMLCSFDEP